jgi:ketosteroid isomerase-like protein
VSKENVDLVRSIFADWERGDFSRSEWADPDIEYVIVDGPDPGSTRGLAAMARRAGEELSPAQNTRLAAKDIRELDGERVLVVINGSGRGKSSGVEIDYEEIQVFDFRDGKVIRLTVYYEPKGALADLGLEE